ncbi:hypothetical protein M1B72_05345 [Geomonas paludis]|uniref:Uncharacterized protein n=1 Tax=Geomonas paludis TaxID=2740185 RepID=A0A6V8MYN5_9BACT|nr:hypothetical protein [Geomonas paludis]UPU37136.1 hypothetical protein M1B72_05345 [Geomonas paludis]GFO64767.1 hypothetical protein GMPD_26860 [Geomonas paludis]
MRKRKTHSHVTIAAMMKLLAMVMLCVSLTACTGPSSKKHVFWPPAPNLPRVQFLKAIKDSNDVVETKKLSLFDMGEKPEEFVGLVKPYGIAVRDGKIYVCDSVGGQVVIIDLPNKKMYRLAGNVNAGRLKKPINVAVDAKGNLYVSDISRQEVLQYGPDGTFLRSYGRELNLTPVDVRVEENFLYVLDKSSSLVKVFDITSGDLLKSIGQNSDPKNSLSLPTNMASDGKGAIYISNFGNARIIKLDRDGNFLMGHGKMGVDFGTFGRPRGIAVDEQGLVYVVDAAAQLVQIFDDKMRLLMYFGAPGTAGSLNIPAGIAVSSENLDYFQSLAEPGFKLEKVVFVVSQVGEHLVNIYGLGKKEGADYDADVKKTLLEIEKKAIEVEKKRKVEEAEKEKNEKGATSVPGAASSTPQER